ncbi:MAG: glycosyltransferase [Verrucomicrobiota bacterium]|nr:glycosyltransferase [Verrucomicrobiota bacterium]
MIRLPQIFRGPEQPATPPKPDFFDVYHLPTMEAVSDRQGQSLGDWGAEVADDVATAPRLILGLLRVDRALRRRFPDAVSGHDTDFREWLLKHCVSELKLTPTQVANVAAALVEDPGGPVREYFLHSPELQTRYPLGLLPMGQKRFVKWLVGKGRDQHEFSDEQVLWFLHASRSYLSKYIALTYAISPEWQERFPQPDPDGKQLLRWLRAEFPKFAALRRVAEVKLPSARIEHVLTGVNVLSHFCYASGIQEAGLQAKSALELARLKTSCRDVPTGVRTTLLPREDWLGFERYPVTITNVAPEPHFESRYQRAGLLPRKDALTVAYWAWELDVVPNEWMKFDSSIAEVWTPTPFVAESMRKTLKVPIHDMLPPVRLGEVDPVRREEFKLSRETCVFLFMFDMCSDFRRKNPLAVMRAFRQAFTQSDDVGLIIKLVRGATDPENLKRLRDADDGTQMFMIDEFTTRARAYGYIAMSDCVVSLHRSEGFGLLMAEAMLLGKPVIATNYSGNTAFMDRENSLLVDYEMTTIEESGAIYKAGNRWAEPSVGHAAKLMRQVYEGREAAKALGARAKADAEQLLSPQAAGERMKARLMELWRKNNA